jgi:hypothetical protein
MGLQPPTTQVVGGFANKASKSSPCNKRNLLFAVKGYKLCQKCKTTK